ncbi:hypothetical protein [Sulfuricella sp.]|uniref:hypothetical protein n=1 Tax=Sulfuricella sp. TaxID=2099377 RepID=UPI002C1C84D2|nr:hypothetical protein [Sulfuricella sp.]HUX63792.1 hypothetical protein [Sulfuricella sp.]
MEQIMLCLKHEKRQTLQNRRSPIMHSIINQLKNLFAAIAYAEAGDLDAVKQILQENPSIPAKEKGAETTAQPPAIPVF